MYKKQGNTVWSFLLSLLIEVGFIVPVVGTAKIIIVLYLLGQPITIPPLLAMALVTIPVYFGDRLFVDEEDKGNTQKSLRNFLLQKYQSSLKLLVFISFGGFLLLSITHLSPLGILSVQFPFFIFLLYPYLKQVPHIDTVSIATAWSVELLLVAIFFTPLTVTVTPTLVSVFCIMFVMKMAETELSNIRDVHGDTQAGNKTFPIIYGIPPTKDMISICVAVTLSAIAFLSPPSILTIYTILLGISLGYIIQYTTTETARDIMFIDRVSKISIAIVVLLLPLL